MSSATVSLGHAVSAAHVFGHELRSSFVSERDANCFGRELPGVHPQVDYGRTAIERERSRQLGRQSWQQQRNGLRT
jgi:hypothetical protein